MAKKKLKARGNFRRVTPAVAERYIKYWEKRGATKADQIPAGKDSEFQKIRLREALSVWRDFSRKTGEYEKAKAEYDAKLAEFKALSAKGVFEHAGLPAKYLRPKAPAKPAKTGPRSKLGGNFRKVTRKQAQTYLRSLFTRAAKNTVAGVVKTKTGKKAKRITMERLPKGSKGNQIFSPRVKEAILLLGPEASTQLWVNANKLQAKLAEQKAVNDKKAEERKTKADATKVAAHQKKIERAQKRLADLQAAGAGIVAARRARRSRRSSRRLRRRNRR